MVYHGYVSSVISILYDSPLKRGVRGVLRQTLHTPLSPLFRGEIKSAAFGILINTYSGSFRGKLTAECVMRSNVVDDR